MISKERAISTLLKLLSKNKSIQARTLFYKYKQITNDKSRSQPRMIVLDLISKGIVEWTTGGMLVFKENKNATSSKV